MAPASGESTSAMSVEATMAADHQMSRAREPAGTTVSMKYDEYTAVMITVV